MVKNREANACMLTSLLACAQSISPLIPLRTPCLGNGSTRSGLGLPTSMNLVKITPTDVDTGKANADNPSLGLFPGNSRSQQVINSNITMHKLHFDKIQLSPD